MIRRGILAVTAVGIAASAHAATRTLTPVAMVNQPVAGSSGQTVASIGQAVFNGNGVVGFTGTLNLTGGGTTGFYFYNNQISFLSNSVSSPVLTGTPEEMSGISNAGEFVLSQSIDAQDGIYGRGLKLARSTETAPVTGLAYNSLLRPTMLPDGTIHYISTFGSGAATTRALYRVAPDAVPTNASYSVVRKNDDTFNAAGGLRYVTRAGVQNQYEVSNNGSNLAQIVQVAAAADTNIATQALVVKNNSVVSETGGTVTLNGGTSGFTWGTSLSTAFASVSTNDSGVVLATGVVTAATDNSVLAINNDVRLRGGTGANASNIGGINLFSVTTATLNNNNQVLHLWRTSSSVTSARALFLGDASDLLNSQLLLATGDELDVNGDTIVDYTITGLLDSGSAAKGLDLSDSGIAYVRVQLTPIGGDPGTSGFTALLAIPEPATLSLLGLGALAIGRRRRA